MKKEERKDRRAQCQEFLRRAGSMPAAIELAKEEGFSANTSVWIGALSEMLSEMSEQQKPKKRKKS